MSKLVVLQGDNVLGEHALDQERIYIGRKPHNDIILPHSGVSGEHALIITIREDSFLEDLNSTNGTRVNGRLVEKCALQDGDEIGIARFRLRFVYEANVQNEESDFSDDLETLLPFLESGSDDSIIDTSAGQDTKTRPWTPRGRPLVGETGEPETRTAVVEVLTGPGAGGTLPLTKALTTIGKPGQQVAVITRRDYGYFLTHIDGEDYPRLNGVSIGAQSHALRNRDIIELAGTKLEFSFR